MAVRCCLTGDGKAMQATNYAPGHSCWVCSLPRADWAGHLEPSPDLSHALRYGAFLRDIPSSHAMEVIHANHPIVNVQWSDVVQLKYWGRGC